LQRRTSIRPAYCHHSFDTGHQRQRPDKYNEAINESAMTLIEPSTPSPGRRRLAYALVLTPLLIGNAVMLVLCLLGFHVLSATRAYVGGESHWSKARAQAVRHLHAYALDGSPQRWRQFEQALQVPLGDRAARLELDRPEADLQRAAEGLARGGNAAADIPGMIRLYRWFGRSELMADSVHAWRRGDELIDQLQDMGRRLHQLRPDGQRRADITALLLAMDELDMELLSLERQFSQALGQASRATYETLAWLIGLTALLLTLTASVLARAGLRRQRRDETALMDANRRWSLAAQSDGLGVFEWMQRDDRVMLDARACAVYGLASGPEGLSIERSQVRALVEQEDILPLQQDLDHVLESSARMFRHRFRIRPPGSQALRHIEITGVMHGSVAKGDRRMVGVIKDVSAQVLQGQMALDKAAAERSAAARMEFLSRLSHELRTPLNAVLGLSELMMLDRADALTPGQQRRVQLIGDAGRHLLRLVDDVLDISSIDAGRFSVDLAPVPLAAALNAAAALVDSEAQAQAVEIVLAPTEPAGLRVLADEQRLGQVLTNLFSNACKYNRHGGRMSVRATQQQDWVRIEVEDQGAGIAPAEQAQLFQPFKRLPDTAHLQGTGLGLSIVKLLVEQMGGSVELSSTPGRGSVFTVLLRSA
jgi:signal transduction histidine kinase